MMYLPFRVIFDLYTSKKIPRYDGQKYATMSRVYAKNLNEILFNPEEKLRELGVDLDGLEFFKRKFPRDVYANNFKINSFPALIVRDKGNKKWGEKFNSFMGDRIKHSLDFSAVVESLEETLFEEGYEVPQKPEKDEEIPF